MDYIRQQVFILLNFKTPFDYPDRVNDFNSSLNNSLLDGKGGAQTVETFSGLYRVTRVTSEFSGGQFSQDLEMLRMPNQSITDDEPESNTQNLKVEKDSQSEPGKGTNSSGMESGD
jgi:hypothetical protein